MLFYRDNGVIKSFSVNDDTDDEQARSKKRKSMWDESESEESDKDWGQKKRRYCFFSFIYIIQLEF